MINPIQKKACDQYKLYVSLQNNNNIRRTPVSPYPTYTKQQLDMRRKAEILEYKTQQNVPTTNQKWAYLVQTSSGSKKRACLATNYTVRTPTSSSDVPGPVIQLYKDPLIPLYMYVNQTVDNAQQEVPYPNLQSEAWTTHPIIDAYFKTTVPATLANLVLLNPEYVNYSYTIKTPISISLSGIKTALQPQTTIISQIVSTISAASLSVYYSDVLIQSYPINVTTLSNAVINLGTTSGSFLANKYVGHITIPTINLETIPEYVYTFSAQFTVSYVVYDQYNNIISNTSTTTNIGQINNSVVANIVDIADVYFNTQTNCTLQNPPHPVAFLPFTIQGIPNGNSF
jgi:hypothetical protein